MSLIKALFGLGKSKPSATAAPPMREYKGYVILATPFANKGQFQVCGLVRGLVDGVEQEHEFIRVDQMPTRDEAIDFTFWKGEQMIDQLGDRLFKANV